VGIGGIGYNRWFCAGMIDELLGLERVGGMGVEWLRGKRGA
jgi:hypothetical protein